MTGMAWMDRSTQATWLLGHISMRYDKGMIWLNLEG